MTLIDHFNQKWLHLIKNLTILIKKDWKHSLIKIGLSSEFNFIVWIRIVINRIPSQRLIFEWHCPSRFVGPNPPSLNFIMAFCLVGYFSFWIQNSEINSPLTLIMPSWKYIWLCFCWFENKHLIAYEKRQKLCYIWAYSWKC